VVAADQHEGVDSSPLVGRVTISAVDSGHRIWSSYAAEGFGAVYHLARPSPPETLLRLLCRLARVERPRLVVDVGSGTGLSTRAWASLADEVVGVEPNPEMRAAAEADTSFPNVRYVAGYSDATGLDDSSADVVTYSQSLHWMEPQPTFAEAARVLRPGGVFAAYDYELPPAVDWEVDSAFEYFLLRVGKFRRERLSIPPAEKAGHVPRMRESGLFRYVRELGVSGDEPATAERVVGLALSLGPVGRLLEEGLTEEEIGLAGLREAAERVLGDREVPWTLTYRVRFGIV
jgi:SAM-dependent methyltransferase